MKNFFKQDRWSSYAVGALLGVLSWVTFWGMNKALGVSTTFVQAAGIVEGTISPEHVSENSYFAKYLVGTPAFEWQFALVVALFFGALISAKLSGSKRVEYVPAIWAERFGPSRLKRYLGAFLGGVLLLFGARMAGGCTSGHGISGGLQLAVSSWVFMVTFIGVGIAAAFSIYKPKQK
jgi:uncharacterized membrane protein YedE/YeeE